MKLNRSQQHQVFVETMTAKIPYDKIRRRVKLGQIRDYETHKHCEIYFDGKEVGSVIALMSKTPDRRALSYSVKLRVEKLHPVWTTHSGSLQREWDVTQEKNYSQIKKEIRVWVYETLLSGPQVESSSDG